MAILFYCPRLDNNFLNAVMKHHSFFLLVFSIGLFWASWLELYIRLESSFYSDWPPGPVFLFLMAYFLCRSIVELEEMPTMWIFLLSYTFAEMTLFCVHGGCKSVLSSFVLEFSLGSWNLVVIFTACKTSIATLSNTDFDELVGN